MAVDGQRFMTKTQHYRKVTKPLLERKRRARMNLYLDELKELIVDTMETEGDNINKLEKADILELTVNYLKTQCRKGGRMSNMGETHRSPPINLEKFRAGYVQAAHEVSKVVANIPGMDIQLGTHLMQRLGCQLQDIDYSPLAYQATAASPSSRKRSSSEHSYQVNVNVSENKRASSTTPTTMAKPHPVMPIPKAEDVWRPW